MEHPSPGGPWEPVVFYDYHCPYSHRVVAWLDALGATRVRPTYRMFGLEQVNRDPTATDWRLWEQPLDYEHHRARQDRRSLPAFLATAILERTSADAPQSVAAYRRAVYRTRFEGGADISDRGVLRAAAAAAGVDPDRIDPWTVSAEQLEAARARLAADWAEARRDYAVFGVPTLRTPGEPPWYLRLERVPSDAEALDLLERLVGIRAAAPYVLELKVPEPTLV